MTPVPKPGPPRRRRVSRLPYRLEHAVYDQVVAALGVVPDLPPCTPTCQVCHRSTPTP